MLCKIESLKSKLNWIEIWVVSSLFLGVFKPKKTVCIVGTYLKQYPGSLENTLKSSKTTSSYKSHGHGHTRGHDGLKS